MMPVEEAIEQARDWARDNQRKSVYAASALAYIDAIPQNRAEGEHLGMSQDGADSIQLSYVLSNLGSWRGENARECKAVIKAAIERGRHD